MKKVFFSLFLSLLMVITPLSVLAESGTIGTPAFDLTSEAVILYNPDTGQILYEKNADKSLDMTGLSQIMTALVVMERAEDLDEEKVKARAILYDRLYGMGYPTADVRQGEILSVRELLYCMMVQNSYEAAEILGDYISEGSEAYFAELMNRKAKELGMENTVFTNASGRENTGQSSTARDMLLLLQAGMADPVISEMGATLRYTVAANNVHSQSRILVNSNRLMNSSSQYYYEGANGLKVVGTLATGRCGLFSATKNGLTYYLVVLGSPALDDKGEYIAENGALTDAKKLFQWAFSNYSYKELVDIDSPCTQIKVTLSSDTDFVLLYPKENFSRLVPNEVDETSIYLRPVLPEFIEAPIAPGQEIGYGELVLSGEVIGKVPLIAKDEVKRSQILYLAQLTKNIFLSPWAFLVYGLLLLLIVGYIVLAVYHNIQKKKHPTLNRKAMQSDRKSVALQKKRRIKPGKRR